MRWAPGSLPVLLAPYSSPHLAPLTLPPGTTKALGVGERMTAKSQSSPCMCARLPLPPPLPPALAPGSGEAATRATRMPTART